MFPFLYYIVGYIYILPFFFIDVFVVVVVVSVLFFIFSCLCTGVVLILRLYIVFENSITPMGQKTMNDVGSGNRNHRRPSNGQLRDFMHTLRNLSCNGNNLVYSVFPVLSFVGRG